MQTENGWHIQTRNYQIIYIVSQITDNLGFYLNPLEPNENVKLCISED